MTGSAFKLVPQKRLDLSRRHSTTDGCVTTVVAVVTMLALSSERRGDRTCWDPLALSCCALRASSCRHCSIWNPEGVNRVNNTTSGQLFLLVTAHWQQEKAHQPARYQAINTRESPQIFIGSLPTSSLNLTLGWLRAGVVQLGNRLYRKHVDNRGHRACRWSLAKKQQQSTGNAQSRPGMCGVDPSEWRQWWLYRWL
jgi:hypothetical protein